MIYDENHDPEMSVSKEIVGSWILAISLVGVIFFVLGLFV